MVNIFVNAKRGTIPAILLVLANLAILIPLTPAIHLVGTTILFWGLSGWVLLEAFFPLPVGLVERLALSVGLSFSLSIVMMLLLLALPGTVSLEWLLGVQNIVVAILFLIAFLRRHQLPHLKISRPQLYWALAILGVAFLIRIPMMGYSEFHEDEVEVTSFAARILAGEDYAIYLHRKGPVQTLIPVMTWLTTNSATEPITRFPFLFASAFGVLGVYVLGERLRNRAVGIIAALLMVTSGYSVGFGRMVQYQAVILLLAPLIIWTLWFAYSESQPDWLIPGLFMVSVGLLAHFDMLLYIPIVLYLLGLIFLRTRGTVFSTMWWVVIAGVVAAAVLASFYIPYIRDPQFDYTLSYLYSARS